MEMDDRIRDHLNQFNLDLRISNNGRFMDQKVTPDVLSFMSDCICNYIAGDINEEFTVYDIWNSSYFGKNVQLIFSKPSVENETVTHEYDKFIAQPIKTLEYAGILIAVDIHRRPIHYKVQNLEFLQYIALKEIYALNFLHLYLGKVLKDSGFIEHINRFISDCNSRNMDESKFQDLKSTYQRFIIGNTLINTKVEVNRIFTKVLNVFSALHNVQGTIKGRLSDRPIYYRDLMYNRINFRDLEKDKGVSRQEASIRIIPDETMAYNQYVESKAIRIIREKYKQSEAKDDLAMGAADHVHHIFPSHEFPRIVHYLENLIKLTAGQHLSRAHPNGNTRIISRDYQLVCLMGKSRSIQHSLSRGEFLYSKPSFIYVIIYGLKMGSGSPFTPNMNFEQIRSQLQTEYKKL